jgi:predicted O-methyltransferase YrrM
MATFSSNWFETLAKPNFENVIVPIYKNKPFKYLEIGSFEGASLHYLFNNCNDFTASVIDPFDNFNGTHDQLGVFKKNLEGYLHRIDITKGYSHLELHKFQDDTFDVIYIDGDHTSKAALTDALLSFRLLKVGGYLIFDDYVWIHDDGSHQIPDDSDPRLQNILNPFVGINIFWQLHRDSFEIVVKNWQLILKRIR